MSLQSATYHYLSCNGKLNNLVQPDCPTVSEGSFADKTEMLQAAINAGWTVDGRSHSCPDCSRRAVK